MRTTQHIALSSQENQATATDNVHKI